MNSRYNNGAGIGVRLRESSATFLNIIEASTLSTVDRLKRFHKE